MVIQKVIALFLTQSPCLLWYDVMPWTHLFYVGFSRSPPGVDIPQVELLYVALYLLIWGEASNVRFMPECLCYIFHNVSIL